MSDLAPEPVAARNDQEPLETMGNSSPSSSPMPTPENDRIAGIDVLRGFALLGILLMNIRSFGMIGAAYFFPLAYGDLTGVNLAAWWFTDLFADSKFITLFSMLFGAGVLLQTRRGDEAGHRSGRIYYRRLLWLWLFGLGHAYLLWEGDILVLYAIVGLLLYPLRKVRPSRLLALGVTLLVIGTAIMAGMGLSVPYWPEESVAGFNANWQPSAGEVAEELAALRGDWLQEIRYRAPHVLEMHFMVIPFFLFWRTLGVMSIGMALFKWGLLNGRFRGAHKVFLAVLLPLGLALSILEGVRQFAHGWDPPVAFLLDSNFGYWGSLLMAPGYLALVFLFVERGWWKGLQARLAAVGRTALSNYLLHTLLCTFLFFGRGFGLFGKVPRIGLLGIVVAIWLLQLWLAPWWLKRFRMGPAEWLWRTLTYLKPQPFRR